MNIETIRVEFPEAIGIADQELKCLIELINCNPEIKVIRESFRLFNYFNTSGLFLYDKKTYESYINDTSQFKVSLKSLPHVLLCNGDNANTVELIERMIAFIKK